MSGLTKNDYFDKYQNWAYKIAHDVFEKTRFTGVEFEDYKQYALLGLTEAISRSDNEKEDTFMAYSKLRIRGAILNSIFKFSEKNWCYSQSAKKNQEYRVFYIDSILSENTSASSKLSNIVGELAFDYLLAENNEFKQDVESTYGGEFYNNQEVDLLQTKIEEKRECLSEELQSVLNLYYNAEKSYAEIAEIMNVSKSQVFKLHNKAIELLKI